MSSSQYKNYLELQRKKLEERTQNLNELINKFRQQENQAVTQRTPFQRATTANPVRRIIQDIDLARNLNLKLSSNDLITHDQDQFPNGLIAHNSVNSQEKKRSRLEDYIVGKTIGQGAYAVCKLAIHKETNKKLAIKVYDKYKLIDPQRKKSVKREIQVMEKLDHPNIVQLIDLIENPKSINLVMDYISGPSMRTYIKKKISRQLDENEAKRIFKQIISAMQYCHSKNITHRDIKLENILLDDLKNVKIIDFGFSTIIPNDQKVKMFCGTPSYMAPEIVMKKEYVGPPVDIWASGVLLFAILCGHFPFKGPTDRDLYKKISRGAFTVPENIPKYAKELLQKILQVNPNSRPSAEQILQDP